MFLKSLPLCIPFLLAQMAIADWNPSLSLGFNVARGNTENTQFNTRFDAKKKWEKDSLSFKAAANFGEDEVKKNTDNYLIESQYNRTISKNYFWFINGSYEIDYIADLDHRILLSPGLGYQLINKKNNNWDIEAGIGFQNEKYGGLAAEDSLAYRFAEKWDYQFSKQAGLWHSAEISGETEEGDDYIVKAVLGIKTQVVSNISLKSFVKEKYTNMPARRKKKNDLSFNTVLVYSF